MGAIYIQYEYWIAVFQLVLAMLGMGATLTSREFFDVVRAPKPVTVGLVAQILLVPFTAFIFLKTLGINSEIAVGIALIAAIPGGSTSNIFTFFARGNSALSISITGLTTIACLLTTPLILALLISDSLPVDFLMPKGKIINEIAFTLLIPLFLGMLFYNSIRNTPLHFPNGAYERP